MTPQELIDRRVVYSVPGMDHVTISRDLVYKTVDGLQLKFDVYRPSGNSAPRRPAIVFVNGDGPPEMILRAKDWGQYTSWGKLAAGVGLVGVTFNHRSTERLTKLRDASSDVSDLLAHIQESGGEFGIDTRRQCVWVCSAGGPLVLPDLISQRPGFLRCTVVYYARLDLRHLREPTSPVVDDETLRAFSPLQHLEQATSLPPMLIVRAGRDRPELNETMDRFVSVALSRNLPVEVINHPDGQHGFDTLDDIPRSHEVIRRTLEFMRAHLSENGA